ncbi:hypothetical protein NDU88_005669 [Pleurodeles waltl]|uniref:Uncharacterized protein n=1 Tax=Pleurodeles waltl TaxID=8319 RepID=A0AAV7VMN0_PLEWA|nr:hypothetical protein NDU88_005669 [Pleurodeles waltl]
MERLVGSLRGLLGGEPRPFSPTHPRGDWGRVQSAMALGGALGVEAEILEVRGVWRPAPDLGEWWMSVLGPWTAAALRVESAPPGGVRCFVLSTDPEIPLEIGGRCWRPCSELFCDHTDGGRPATVALP